MTKQEFSKLAQSGTVLLDGAMGTNLYAAGMPRRTCPEKWILENPGVVLDLQKAYVEAGSRILYAPTFGANRHVLKGFSLEDQIIPYNRRLTALCREAAGDKALVAGDVAPTGMLLEDLGGDNTEEEIYDNYAEQIKILAEEGVDLIVVETQMSVDEACIALHAALDVCSLPVMVTLTADPNGRCLFGGTVADGVRQFQKIGASAAGINCCSGPDRVLKVVREMSEGAEIPLIVKPNAGTPVVDAAGNAHYDMGPEQFADCMREICDTGVRFLGGCCGTTPAYIRELSRRLDV